MSPKDALDKFIASWRSHDIKELTDLFAEHFEYKINGRLRFNQKKELRRYWAANLFRQVDLKIFTQFEQAAANSISSHFTALFYNPGRFSITAVSGQMTICLNQSGKIEQLIEEYEKTEKRSALYSLDSFHAVYLAPIRRAAMPTITTIQKVAQKFARLWLLCLFLVGLIGMIYINFVHEQTHWIDDALVGKIKPYTAYYFVVLYVIHQFLPFVREKISPDIEVRKFAPPGDLDIMAKELRNADRVSILSGDFSFLSDNKKLEETLRALAFAGKLELFSYKCRAEVEAEAKIKSKNYEIFLKLIDDRNLHFDVGVKAKCTVAEFSNVKKLLFRFSGDAASSDERHMGIVRRKEKSQYLIEIVDRMFDSLRVESTKSLQSPPQQVPLNPTPTSPPPHHTGSG